MARSMPITLDGKDYTLSIGWKASSDISANVFDLLLVTQEAILGHKMAKAGIPYAPKHEIGIEEVVKVLYYGLRAGGHDVTPDQVGEAVVADGWAAHLETTLQYILSFSSPTSKEVKGGAGGKK